MPWLVLGVSVVIGVILVMHWFVDADVKKVLRVLRWVGIAFIVLVGGFLLISGRLAWLWIVLMGLLPWLSRLRMLRNWGGAVDMTPDRSPIIAKTPVPGLYLNGGWGSGGFKATPGAGHLLAWTVAKDEPHVINAPFNLERFRSGRLIDEAAAAAVAH